MPGTMIRPAREDELREPGVIEWEADVLFTEIGMNDMAAAAPESLLSAQRIERLPIAMTHADEPMGFIRLEIVNLIPHAKQISVLPRYAGCDLGVRLLGAAEK